MLFRSACINICKLAANKSFFSVTHNYTAFSSITNIKNVAWKQGCSREEYSILSAILVSWGLSWKIEGSLYIPKDAASNRCTMTSAIKVSSKIN